jgi:FxLD family lantipeptide
MTIQLAATAQPATDVQPATGIDRIPDDFDLDIEFIEAGGTIEHIIKMTEDNCGTTCESACTSC